MAARCGEAFSCLSCLFSFLLCLVDPVVGEKGVGCSTFRLFVTCVPTEHIAYIQRHINVTTLHRRWYDVVSILHAVWEFVYSSSWCHLKAKFCVVLHKHRLYYLLSLFMRCVGLITKTCLYNFDPLKPLFYIVKLGFTGVYIIFLISDQKHRLWVLVRTASARRF